MLKGAVGVTPPTSLPAIILVIIFSIVIMVFVNSRVQDYLGGLERVLLNLGCSSLSYEYASHRILLFSAGG